MYHFDFSKLNLPRETKLKHLEAIHCSIAKDLAQQKRFSAILQNMPITTASQGNKNMDLFPPKYIYETNPTIHPSLYNTPPTAKNPGSFHIDKIRDYASTDYASTTVSTESKEASNILEKILDHSPVHITEHFRKRTVNNDSGFGYTYVITISNAEPKITALSVENPWQKEASWQKEDLAVDIFFYEQLTMQQFIEMSDITGIFPHWINILCSVMTFKGNEVFLNGKLFLPN